MRYNSRIHSSLKHYLGVQLNQYIQRNKYVYIIMITIQWYQWKNIYNNINEILYHQRDQKKKYKAKIIGQCMPTEKNKSSSVS